MPRSSKNELQESEFDDPECEHEDNNFGEDVIRNCLSSQLSEIEMLQSMYPNENEFQLEDKSAVVDVQEYLDETINYKLLTKRISFVLRIVVTPDDNSLAASSSSTRHPMITIEVFVHLPHGYPKFVPDISLRCDHYSRFKLGELTSHLLEHLSLPQFQGELMILELLEQLKVKCMSFQRDADERNCSSCLTTSLPSDGSDAVRDVNKCEFSRIWIYSHHIYSKIKRRDILDFAEELVLTGFSMPGKPGMIVVEGAAANAEEFWRRIRRMQWQRLTMKTRDELPLAEGQDLDSLRKFDGFCERGFAARTGKHRGVRMDLGLLFKFLDEKGFGEIFNLYFGVEGR